MRARAGVLDRPRPGTAPPDKAHGRRPALDGIRALAVVAVVVYHFGGGATSWLPGGFLGVDVFFVLSGYLITGLLLSEHARTGGIDLAAFWVRRARRLMPALILVLLAVCAWVWLTAEPTNYPRRREDVFWTLGYLANWHFVGAAEDYFAAYTSASPLRHAWSLAVEEQFYLVWPTVVLALFWVGRRITVRRKASGAARGRRPIGAGLVVGGFSLVAAIASAATMAALYDPASPTRAYYGTDGRVQQLLIGALLAVLLTRRERLGRMVSAARGRSRYAVPAAAAALGLLLAAMLVMSDTAPPYYLGGAMLVALLTAALIAGVEVRPEGRLARAFSWRPAVLLGRISYGVYLWHWPVVVVVPVPGSLPLGEQVRLQALRVALSLGLAALSYVLVEKPVMERRWFKVSKRRVLGAAVASVAAVVAVAIPATALPGTLARQLSETSDHPCADETRGLMLACTMPAGSTAVPDVAVLGDSTARALAPGMDAWARENGSSWIQAAWQRCSATGLVVMPSDEAGTEPEPQAADCAEQSRVRILQALDRWQPRTVLVAEYWTHHQAVVVNGRRLEPGTAGHANALRDAYVKLVDEVAARGGRVVFVELPPPGEGLATMLATGRPAGWNSGPAAGGEYVEGFNDVLRGAAALRADVATTVPVSDVACPGGTCVPMIGDTLVRTDGVHWSSDFSRRLVPELLARAGVTR